MEFSSKLIEKAVNEFAQLPGVGKKTALRFVLHLLRKEESAAESFSESILRLRKDICFCSNCHNISDKEKCDICLNPNRDASTICVVQDIRDVMAIENTGLFRGHYHVLGGIISPMDGIGPANLNIDSLVNKVATGTVKEVIMALSSTMEGETTNFYVFKRISSFEISVSTIARGIPIGDELEYADEVTLGRSIQQRVPYTNQLAAR
jgi:recombination protein RecR